MTHDGQPCEGSRPERRLPAGTVDLLKLPLVLCCPYRLVSMSLDHVFSLLSSLNLLGTIHLVPKHYYSKKASLAL